MNVRRHRNLGQKLGIAAERAPIGTKVGDPRQRILWSVSLSIGRYEYSANHLQLKP